MAFGDPPPVANEESRWHAVVQSLKERPGQWAQVSDVHGAGSYTTQIRRGALRDFRPAGDFEAVSRKGVLWVRYVGAGWTEPDPAPDSTPGSPARSTALVARFADSLPGPRGKWYDVAGLLRERSGEWAVLQGEQHASVPSRINRGEFGAFYPAGSFEAVRRGGQVWVRHVGDQPPSDISLARLAASPPDSQVVVFPGAAPDAASHWHLVAESLRARPGDWGRPVHGRSDGSIVANIRRGELSAFRPAGAFEAKVRQGELWARYVGAPGARSTNTPHDYSEQGDTDSPAVSWADQEEIYRAQREFARREQEDLRTWLAANASLLTGSPVQLAAGAPIPAGMRARLQALQAEAAQLRGHHPRHHPFRLASIELSDLIARIRESGSGYREIAEAVGVSPATIRSRLRAHALEDMFGSPGE